MPSAASMAEDSSSPSCAISQAPEASDSSVTDRMTNASPKRACRGWDLANCRVIGDPLVLRYESWLKLFRRGAAQATGGAAITSFHPPLHVDCDATSIFCGVVALRVWSPAVLYGHRP